jgi:1-deoxy-D-xylulose-5-phosphate synthase
VFIHVITKKGKGYRKAEKNPDKYHGIGPINQANGKEHIDESSQSCSACLGEKLTEMAEKDTEIIAVTAAMKDGTGLKGFSEKWPNRFFDVGIAEAHAVTFAAGLALSGYKPYVAIYSPFLQRAYDQILVDVCLQKLPVTFCVDRAGINGADGETHHGLYDISYFNQMPGITIAAPTNNTELELLLEYSCGLDGPMAIRYPRCWEEAVEIVGLSDNEGADMGLDFVKSAEAVCKNLSADMGPDLIKPVEAVFDNERLDAGPDLFEDSVDTGPDIVIQGKSIRILDGVDVDIWAVGSAVYEAKKICLLLKERGISCGLVNPLFIKPFDKEGLIGSAKKYKNLVTLEDNVISGGFGESVAAFLMAEGLQGVRVLNIAWPSESIPQGEIGMLRKLYGINAGTVADKVEQLVAAKSGS